MRARRCTAWFFLAFLRYWLAVCDDVLGRGYSAFPFVRVVWWLGLVSGRSGVRCRGEAGFLPCIQTSMAVLGIAVLDVIGPAGVVQCVLSWVLWCYSFYTSLF
ncbi:hypothetical protein E4T56_gene6356 [Termitomyces sp. T112]|nr:hypothetical protein E4T56_gene6356 [Termitomyces sp. T112]